MQELKETRGANMNRIFLATPDRDEAEWFADELNDSGRIVRTIDSLDFFVPQWESVEANVVIFMESIIQSEESFQRLITKIRDDRPGVAIMLVYHRDEDDFIRTLLDDGITCLNYMDLEPGIVEVRMLGALGVAAPVHIRQPESNGEGEKNEQVYEDDWRATDSEVVEAAVETVVDDHQNEEEHSSERAAFNLGERAREFGRHISATSIKLFSKIEEKKKQITESKKQAAIDTIRTEDYDFEPVTKGNNRRKKDRFVGGTAVIAVTGVNQGVGCTHTAIMIANYLARDNYPVLLIEANDSNDFVEIEAAYEGVVNPSTLKNPTFTIHGVRYLKAVKELNLYQHLSGNYAFIILDLGSYSTTDWYEEFLRANISIVVGSGSDWKQKDILRFFREQIHLDQSRWKLCVPMATKQTIGDIRKSLPKRKIHALPYQPDPYKADKALNAVLEDVLRLHQHQRLSVLKKKMQAYFHDN